MRQRKVEPLPWHPRAYTHLLRDLHPNRELESSQRAETQPCTPMHAPGLAEYAWFFLGMMRRLGMQSLVYSHLICLVILLSWAFARSAQATNPTCTL